MLYIPIKRCRRGAQNEANSCPYCLYCPRLSCLHSGSPNTSKASEAQEASFNHSIGNRCTDLPTRSVKYIYIIFWPVLHSNSGRMHQEKIESYASFAVLLLQRKYTAPDLKTGNDYTIPPPVSADKSFHIHPPRCVQPLFLNQLTSLCFLFCLMHIRAG